mgnify:CR=1 FL=1
MRDRLNGKKNGVATHFFFVRLAEAGAARGLRFIVFFWRYFLAHSLPSFLLTPLTEGKPPPPTPSRPPF